MENPERYDEKISPIVDTFKLWEKREGKLFGIKQALHPASLKEIVDWDSALSPGEIARYIFDVAPNDVRDWISDRKDSQWLEKGDYYDRVEEVKLELEKIIENNSGTNPL